MAVSPSRRLILDLRNSKTSYCDRQLSDCSPGYTRPVSADNYVIRPRSFDTDFRPNSTSPALRLKSYSLTPDSPIFRLRSRRMASSKNQESPVLLRKPKNGNSESPLTNSPPKRPSTWNVEVKHSPKTKFHRSKSGNFTDSPKLSKKARTPKNFDYVLNSDIKIIPARSDFVLNADHNSSSDFVNHLPRKISPQGFPRWKSADVALMESTSPSASSPDLLRSSHVSLYNAKWRLENERTPDSPPVFLRLFRSKSSNDKSGTISSKFNSINSRIFPRSQSDYSDSLVRQKSRLRNHSLYYLNIVATQLWTDSIGQDPFNTFRFSENQLEKIIHNLEEKLSGANMRNEALHDFIITDYDCAVPPEENGHYENISYHYAMELYCNLYQGKQDLRELKMLQKEENKAYQELLYKAEYMRDQQETKSKAEMQLLVKNYDTDLDLLNKQQKQQVEKAEASQGADLKVAAKKLKHDQEIELKLFRNELKQELKLLKQETDHIPKDKRKDAFKKRKEEKEIEQAQKERRFLEKQQEQMDKSMKRLMDQHKAKVALLEKQFLQQKQQLLRAREAALWELEERQLQERHQLAKRQLKDLFFLKRHQMLTRHEKELEQARRLNLRREEDLARRHQLEKKRLPKILKGEMKTRQQMFKQSLRISVVGSPEEERDKIKQFEESEKKRYKSEILRQDLKHSKQWNEVKAKNDAIIHELEQLQAEKRKMLMEHETLKIKELEEQYGREMTEWKAQLRPRKQKLEEDFIRQRDEQEKFYGNSVWSDGDTLSYLPTDDVYSQNSIRSSPSSTRRSPRTTSPQSVRASTAI